LMRRMNARGSQTSGPMNPTDAATQLANNLMQVANDDLAVGRFSEGSKNSKIASEILENNSKIAARQLTQQNKLFTSAIDVLGNAPDTAAGWDQAKMMFQTLHPEEAHNPEIQKILSIPWRPGLVGLVKNSVLDSKQKAETSAANARATASLASARHSDYLTDHVLPVQVRKSEAQIEALKKAGASHLAPTTTDIKQLVDLALPNFPGQVDTPEGKAMLYDMSREPAQQARMYEKVGGMSRVDAQNRAFKEAYDQGHYAGLPRTGVKDLGTSVDKPLPTPKPPSDFPTWSAKDKQSWIKKNVKDNMFYVTATGVQWWDGASWRDPEQSKPMSDELERALELGDDDKPGDDSE
jgi:hypothetical protein